MKKDTESTYEGEQRDSDSHGFGKGVSVNQRREGSEYVGERVNDERHGEGTCIWPDGTRYVGEWKNDKRDGKGTCTWADDTKYVGEWGNGRRNGEGICTWSDGKKYVGKWLNNQQNGQGTSTWANGHKYVGAYLYDKKSGAGTYTWGYIYSDGNVESSWLTGVWVKGELSRDHKIESSGITRTLPIEAYTTKQPVKKDTTINTKGVPVPSWPINFDKPNKKDTTSKANAAPAPRRPKSPEKPKIEARTIEDDLVDESQENKKSGLLISAGLASIPFSFMLDLIEPDTVSSSNIFYFVLIILWWLYSIFDYAMFIGRDRYPEYVGIVWFVALGFIGRAFVFGSLRALFG